ncbi:MAG TPA: GNAT family N-acetyltransferase [Candidatus Paceibacterota bacterium]|nr:GNAT family N-acetyltransferase [Candidatus Paceibacterota bacterium]
MDQSISAEIIAPSPSNWKNVGREIYAIEQSVFSEKAFGQEMMAADLNDPQAVLAVLKDQKTIVGFAYALPDDRETAHIVDVVIAPSYQHKGLVAKLMSCLERQLKNNGYKYIETEAMVENGYADKILKNYNAQIIETEEFTGPYGEQRYFKIRL